MGGWALGVLLVGCSPQSKPVPALWLFYDAASTDSREVQRAIEAGGGHVRYASTWLNAVSADISPKRAAQIPDVTHIQRVGSLYAAVSTRPPAHSPTRPAVQQDGSIYGPNFRALNDMGVPQAHALNYNGRDVRVAIIDTGFETEHEAFTGAQILAQRDFINGDRIVADQPGEVVGAREQEIHGTWVWSILGGNRPGQIRGPAFGAAFILAKVDVEQAGETDVRADEDRWVQAVEWAVDTMGARVVNSSLAFRDFSDQPNYTLAQLNGDVALSTRIADAAARRGAIIVTAMGNLGPGVSSLSAPADGDSVIAVGAVDSVGLVLPSSGRGPTGDGRPKPDVAARGVNVFAAAARTPNAYDFVSAGTSLATPLVAGAAAIFVQAWPEFTPMAVREALILSASLANVPGVDNNRGAGVPNIAAAIAFPRGVNAEDAGPHDLNNALTTIGPTFRWNVPQVLPQIRPVYRVDVATDPTFNNIIYTDTTSATSLTARRPLRPAPALWWRVTGEVLLPVIQRMSRVTGPFSVPDWVTLLTLNEPTGNTVNTTRPQFRWEPLAAPAPLGPFTYDFQIIRVLTGAIETVSGLTTSTVTVANELLPNQAYRWRVIARSQLGVADTVDSRGTFVVSSATAPPTTLLYPPFPNPFPRDVVGGNETHLWFDLNEKAVVELSIHDLRGRLIKQLIPAQPSCAGIPLDPGQFGRAGDDACTITRWDGTDQNGERVAPGVYIARLRAGRQVATQHILFRPNR